MLDLGFIWFLVKSMREPFLIVVWVFCMAKAVTNEDGPVKNICFAVTMFGLVYVIVTLGTGLIKDKYKEYRAQQEAAWNVLKETE